MISIEDPTLLPVYYELGLNKKQIEIGKKVEVPSQLLFTYFFGRGKVLNQMGL
jgi:hypothetical protein